MNTANLQRTLFAPHALLPTGWARDVLLAWDSGGTLTAVTPACVDAPGAPRATGAVIPGMPNLHSHAFQRAFAGLTEYRAAADDSFWSWRNRMYRFAAALTPEALEDIATQLYIEMLRAGYTSVCEFHYLHHDRDGRPFADPAEMSLRLVSAAQHAGMVIVADGTDAAAKRLARVLVNDSGSGVMRHADAGYELAVQTARAQGLQLPMIGS